MVSKAIEDVIAERERQVSAEGWSPDHDAAHVNGEMAGAAACYAAATCKVQNLDVRELRDKFIVDFWPWARSWWKPQERRRNLVKAAALIIAEIERLDSAATKSEAA
jgi:hypothetical protein